MRFALVLGASNLNFSATLSKLAFGFLKCMFEKEIESLYMLFVFIYIFGKCLIFTSD